MRGTVRIGDRFYPTDNKTTCYRVSAVSRFGNRITHVTLTAERDGLEVIVSIGEITDTHEWVTAT